MSFNRPENKVSTKSSFTLSYERGKKRWYDISFEIWTYHIFHSHLLTILSTQFPISTVMRCIPSAGRVNNTIKPPPNTQLIVPHQPMCVVLVVIIDGFKDDFPIISKNFFSTLSSSSAPSNLQFASRLERQQQHHQQQQKMAAKDNKKNRQSKKRLRDWMYNKIDAKDQMIDVLHRRKTQSWQVLGVIYACASSSLPPPPVYMSCTGSVSGLPACLHLFHRNFSF